MWKKLKIRYGLTDYQIALLRYLLFTFLSESSKLFFILFLYRRHLALCIATLLFLCCIRRTAGGFHCNTYAGCLLVSTGFAVLCLTLLPLVSLTKTARILLCMVCILINYALAPVSSSKRPVLSATKKKQFKWISTGILIVFFFILLITPENEYMVSGFWVIILHAVQLHRKKYALYFIIPCRKGVSNEYTDRNNFPCKGAAGTAGKGK